MKRYLVPLVKWLPWLTDGLHSDDGALTFVSGRSLIFAWLGLHFEIIFAVEKRP